MSKMESRCDVILTDSSAAFGMTESLRSLVQANHDFVIPSSQLLRSQYPKETSALSLRGSLGDRGNLIPLANNVGCCSLGGTRDLLELIRAADSTITMTSSMVLQTHISTNTKESIHV